jgi:hypothetical protein
MFQVKSCIEEVQGNAVNDSGEADGAETYIKTTACILAKIRCRNYVSIKCLPHKNYNKISLNLSPPTWLSAFMCNPDQKHTLYYIHQH